MLAQYFGLSPSTEAFARKLVGTIQSYINTNERSFIKECMMRLLAVIVKVHPMCIDLYPDINDQRDVNIIMAIEQFGEIPNIIRALREKDQGLHNDLSVSLCDEIASNVPGYKLFVYRYRLSQSEKSMEVIFVTNINGTRKLYSGRLDIDYELRGQRLGARVTLAQTGAQEDVFWVPPTTAFWAYLMEWNADQMRAVTLSYRSFRREQQRLEDEEQRGARNE